MDLKLKELSELLQVSEKTIYRWINDNKIPYFRINHQYRFKTDDINNWTIQNKYKIKIPIDEIDNKIEPITIENSLNNGGIFYNISGNDINTILENSVNIIKIPNTLTREVTLLNLKNREKMATTAVGNGIAFPHPRNPIVSDIADESLSICFLHKPIDYLALDNIKVHTLFIILSAKQTRHLQLISKLSHLCRQEEFIKLLKEQAIREDIIKYILNH